MPQFTTEGYDDYFYGIQYHGIPQRVPRPGTWEDLRFPAQGINPAGSTAPPTVDDGSGGYPGTLIFSGSADNIIAGVAQMPHSWIAGSAIRPHIHLLFPASAAKNTRWKLTFLLADVNGNFAAAPDSTITVANPENIVKHVIASFGEISMTGLHGSCMGIWSITRLANSDAADNDTNACRLLEFDIHYQANKFGSPNETPDGL